jgi:hypothetical protein
MPVNDTLRDTGRGSMPLAKLRSRPVKLIVSLHPSQRLLNIEALQLSIPWLGHNPPRHLICAKTSTQTSGICVSQTMANDAWRALERNSFSWDSIHTVLTEAKGLMAHRS